MKLHLALLLLPLTTSFVLPPAPVLSPAFSSPAFSRTASYLVAPSGRDALDTVVSTSKGPILPPPILTAARTLSVPASLVTGYLITPSRRMLASIVGSALTGTFGVVGRSKLEDVAIGGGKVQLAKLLLSKEKVEDVTPAEVSAVQKAYNVPDFEWSTFKSDIYRDYLRAECKISTLKTADGAAIRSFGRSLGLSPVQVGMAVYDAASGVYQDHVAWAAEEDLKDKEGEEYRCVGKFLYLAGQIFKDEGAEERQYEVGRISKLFGLDATQFADRVGEVARPFYERALTSARTKEGVGADMLRRARDTIGVTDGDMVRMHEDCYSQAVGAVLEEEGSVGGDELERIRSVLSVGEREAKRLEEEKTRPLFEKAVMDALADVRSKESSISSIIGSLAITSNDLCVSSELYESVLQSQVKSSLTNTFEGVAKFVRVGNVAGVEKGVSDMVEYLDDVKAFLDKVGTEMTDDEETLATRVLSFSVGEGMKKEKTNAYRMFLKSSLASNDSKLSEAARSTLAKFAGIVELSKFDSQIVYKEVVGPTLTETVLKNTEDLHSLDGAADVQSVVDSLGLTADAVAEIKMSVYRQRLTEVSESAEGGILSEEQSAGLKSLASFLSVPDTEAAKLCAKVNGPAYKSSVVEAMGESGVIMDSYQEPLDQLRQRLLLDEQRGRSIYMATVAEKMDPMCKGLVTALEDIQKPASNDDKEKDGLGITAEQKTTDFMAACMTLVDFVKGNKAAEQIEDGTDSVTRDVEKEVEKEVEREEIKMVTRPTLKAPGETETVEEKVIVKDTVTETVTETITETVPKYRYEFPLTAQSISSIQDEAAAAIYKQFVIGSFSAKDDKAATYEEYQEQIGLVLGLDDAEMTKIAGSIGAMVFDNYFSTSMQGKSELDQQDMMFLAQIKDKLKMSDDVVERLLLSTQKNLLSKQVERVFVAGTKITAESVRAVRDQAAGMGIDLARDLGVTDDRLGRMFTIEVSEGIEGGAITAGDDGSDSIAEIVEGLGMSEAKAEALLEALVKDRSSRIVKNISADVARGNDARAMKDLPIFISYAKFVGGENLGIKLAKNVVDSIVAVFESATFGQPGAEDDLQILKKALS